MLKLDTGSLPPRKNLSRAIYESLETAIVQGRLQPGTRLAEDRLSTRFGVSRSPVREAISELERVGLAERGTMRDRRVSVPSEAFIVDCFDVWVLLESERLYESSLRSDAATPTQYAASRPCCIGSNNPPHRSLPSCTPSTRPCARIAGTSSCSAWPTTGRNT